MASVRLEFPLALLLYFLLLLAAGLRFPKKLRTIESFFLASRNLGTWRIAFSLGASWIGAATLLVSTDEAYLQGVSALWIIGVPTVFTLLVFVLLARPIRVLSGSTLSDLMEERYGKAARFLTTILIIWYMVMLAASQMVAAGNFLKSFLGTSNLISLIAVVGVVLLYSGAGGFFSVVRTHGLQLFLLLLGVGGLLVALSGRSTWGGLSYLAETLGRTGYFHLFSRWEHNVLIAVSFLLAWTISPIAWQRIQASRSERAARRGLLLAALFLAVFYCAVVLAGMLFLPLFPEGKPLDPLISAFISSASAGIPGLVLFVAVVAAVLSTMDAALNAGAFSLTQDILRYERGGGASSKSLLFGRLSTVLLAFAAFLIATRFESILQTLGLASKIMAEGLFVPGLAAIFLRRRIPLAGLSSLLLGGGYALLCFLEETDLLYLGLPPWPFSLPLGLAIAGGAFLMGLGLERLKGKRRGRPSGGA